MKQKFLLITLLFFIGTNAYSQCKKCSSKGIAQTSDLQYIADAADSYEWDVCVGDIEIESIIYGGQGVNVTCGCEPSILRVKRTIGAKSIVSCVSIEPCCENKLEEGCIAITTNCSTATFTVDPDCLPDCTTSFTWAPFLGPNIPPSFPSNVLSITWTLPNGEYKNYDLGAYVTYTTSNGDQCVIGDEITIDCVVNNIGTDKDTESRSSSFLSENVLYPNPVQRGSSLQLQNLDLEHAQTIEILNLSGNSILKGSLDKTEIFISNEIPTGLYFLRIESISETKVYRFMVQ